MTVVVHGRVMSGKTMRTDGDDRPDRFGGWPAVRTAAATGVGGLVVTFALGFAVAAEFGVDMVAPFVGVVTVATTVGAAVTHRLVDYRPTVVRSVVRWGFVVPVVDTAAFLLVVGGRRHLDVTLPATDHSTLVVTTVCVVSTAVVVVRRHETGAASADR